MGKNVYKIIHFILMLPINIIKYFCLGFYFVGAKIIEIMLHIVFFVSFLLYKTVKYFVLFFGFPVLIFNLIRGSKKKIKRQKKEVIAPEDEIVFIPSYEAEKIIEPIVLSDSEPEIETVLLDDIDFNNNVVDENEFVEQNIIEEIPVTEDITYIDEIPVIDEVDYTDVMPDETIPATSIAEETNIDKPKKVKVKTKPINIFKYLFLPFEIISYPIYKLFKYIVFGVVFTSINIYKAFKYFIFGIVFILKQIGKVFKYLFNGIMFVGYGVYKCFKYVLFGCKFSTMLIYNGFIHLSFYVYKIFKYLLYSLGLPVMIFNLIFNKYKDKIIQRQQQKEINRIKREEEKFKKQLELQKKQEEKLRANIKRRKDKDEYINENVQIEKQTFKQKFDSMLNSLFNFPKVLVEKIKHSINNSVFAKNRRNTKDINRQALLINFEGEDAEKSDVKLVYEYTAKNKDGKVVTDYFEAFSKVEVHSFLLSEGYEVYNIRTNKWIQMLHKEAANSKAKMKNKDLIFFLTQLSTYIKAGIPLVESLKILARQYAKNKKYQRLFSAIIYDLTMGENFSTALSKQGNAFPRILINMVKASEMTGELPEVLDDMAEYFTEMEKTRKQMVTALMYPLIILVVSIAVIVFILLFVIPKFVDIYESMEAAKIPAFTLAVLAVSDFLKNYWYYLLGGVLVFIILFIYLYKNIKVFRTLCQWLVMHMPVFGNVVIYNEVTTFTKTFASLLSHNVFITDSMEILTKITNNEIYKMLILDTITNLAKGEKISTSFKDHWAFPIPAYEMLVTGEKTGQMPEMMAKVADYYQDLHKNSVTRIKTFIEPFLIIFLTVVVGIIVLSIIIPMFSMYSTIQDIGAS